MKMIRSVIVMLFFASPALLAQSTVNIIATPPTRITDATTGQPVGAGYLAALYWAPQGVNRDGFTQVGSAQTVVNGNFPYSGNRTLPTIGAGQTVQLLGAAWEAAFGASYEAASQVVGAKVGESAIVQTPTAGPGVPTIPGVRIPDFQVAPVPEPSTVALLVLGTGALLLRRRR